MGTPSRSLVVVLPAYSLPAALDSLAEFLWKRRDDKVDKQRQRMARFAPGARPADLKGKSNRQIRLRH